MELLIGGRWAASQSGRVEDVTSPFDGAVVGSLPVAGGGRHRRGTQTISAESGKSITEAS